jgi:2-polyprenyl-3-methyl-5-hydroxy-6-metoxy-1,4-benzoquinol methylase
MIRWLKRRFRNCIFPAQELLALVPPSTRLLDIGCGQGQFLKSVAEHRSPVALGGLEIDERLIQIARKELQRVTAVPVKLEVYDGSRFPLNVADYDIISMVDVLHHIPASNQKLFLENLFAQMRSGALLVLKDIDASRAVLCAFNKLHDLVLSGEIGTERSREWAVDVLTQTGFRITSQGERRILVYPHYWLLAVKA